MLRSISILRREGPSSANRTFVQLQNGYNFVNSKNNFLDMAEVGDRPSHRQIVGRNALTAALAMAFRMHSLSSFPDNLGGERWEFEGVPFS